MPASSPVPLPPPAGQKQMSDAIPPTDALTHAPVEAVVVNRPPSNLTQRETYGNVVDGAPHFIRQVEGEAPVCGQDEQPWPCPEWRWLSQGEIDPSAMVSLEQAAQVAGLSPEDFQRRMTELTGNRYGPGR